jgi:putative transcriptional regulator
MMKEKILREVIRALKDAKFEVTDCSRVHSCFDVFAKKENLILLLKALWNIEALNVKVAGELKKVAELVCGVPLVVGYEMKSTKLGRGIVYSRYGINVINVKTFNEMVGKGEFPTIYSIRGNYCVKINSQLLVSLRKKLHLTQRELAHKIGVSKQSIYRYESQGNISFDVAEKILNLFGEGEDMLIPEKPFIVQTKSHVENERGEFFEREEEEHISKLKRIAILELRNIGFKISITHAPFDLVAIEVPEEKEKIFTLVSNDPHGLKKKAVVIRKISEMLHSYKVCISEKAEKDQCIDIRIIKPRDLKRISDAEEFIELLSE